MLCPPRSEGAEVDCVELDCEVVGELREVDEAGILVVGVAVGASSFGDVQRLESPHDSSRVVEFRRKSDLIENDAARNGDERVAVNEEFEEVGRSAPSGIDWGGDERGVVAVLTIDGRSLPEGGSLISELDADICGLGNGIVCGGDEWR